MANSKKQYRKKAVKLIYYVLTDKNGTYIRKDDGSGKYVPIKNERFAARFDNRAKAKNVLDNSIGKAIRSRFQVVEMEETPEIKPEVSAPTFDNVTVKNLTKREPPKAEPDKWIAGIERITEFLTDAETRKQELVEKLSEADRKISDIHHYLEFVSFNCYQGWLVSDLLRVTLAERRRIKDEMAILDNFRNSKLTVETMAQIKNAVDGLGKREYTPRVLTELFGGA